MFATAIVRWLLGWLGFEVIPGIPGSAERFLNLVARRGISLWKIGKTDGRCRACVGVRQYRALRPSARKAGVRLRVKKRSGLPFFVKKLSRRKGIVAGVAAFFLITWGLSQYVWSVNVTGGGQIPPERVIAAASEMGLEPGTLRSRVDVHALQQQLMLEFPDVAWLSVNTHGCCVTVSFEEKTKVPDIVDQKKVCNLKASASGQVLRLEVYAGESQVKVGDAVVEGQLLVSGILEDAQGNTQLRHASGRVIAGTVKSLTAEIPMKQTISEPTGKEIIRRSVKLFGVELPLTFVGTPDGNYKKEMIKEPLVSQNGTVLPVSLYTEVWKEQTQREITLTEQEAKTQAEKKLMSMRKESWRDIRIESEQTVGKVENSKYKLTTTVRCEENIAVESEILFK